MKKLSFVAIAILALALVSCATGTGSTTAKAPASNEPVVITVSSIEDLAKQAKSAPKGATIILDQDITWDSAWDTKAPMEINVSKNITIDLGGHTITGVKTGGFRFFGNFTIQNGTIIGTGDCAGLLINSVNNTSGINYAVGEREEHKVTVSGLKLVDCGIRCELSKVSFKDCDIQNSGDSGNSNAIYMVGVIATIDNCKLAQTASSAVDTISRTNCVYCSGNSTITVTNCTAEGTKRFNAYKNTVSYTVTGVEGANTSTGDVVTIK